jgi:hypothetical protein
MQKIRGEWFNEQGYCCDLSNMGNPPLVIECRSGHLVDAEHGFVIELADAGRGAWELTGWPSGQTFLIHPSDVATVKAVAAGV